jgi:diguanylate cyclase
LEAEVNTFKCTGNEFTVLAIDIDFFKKFNDTYGHAVGDKVLKFVATTMNSVVKGADGLFRTGGEEFNIILPRTAKAGGMVVAEQIRTAVSGKKLIINSEEDKTAIITVSIGVSTFSTGSTIGSVTDLADKNLYKSKHGGRNRVTG